jgi:hypothetical protein
MRGLFLLNQGRGKYKGIVKNGKKEGVGKLKWDNGSEFLGDFMNNKANGFGSYNDNKGSKFVGKKY